MTEPSLLILSFSDLSKDARLLKQIREFAPRYRVSTCGYGPTPEGAERHFQLDSSMIHWQYYRADLILRRYRRAYWRNAAVAGALALLKDQRFDAVLANDFDTVPLAVALKPARGVHADLHEYAPLEKEDLLRWRLFVSPFRAWICRRYLPRCASVTTVSAGLARRYRAEFGVAADVVPNATPFADLRPTPTHRPIRLVHSGVCLRNRSLGLTCRAVAASSADVTLDLYLMPNDPVHLAELQQEFAGEPRIRFREPVPYDQLVPRLNDYDLGIFVLPPRTFSYRHALPNKFFDFVQARLGIIVGPSPEMAALVEAYGNGIVCQDFGVPAVTRALDGLTPELVATWKEASHRSASEASAERQCGVWRSAIAALIGDGR